MIRTVPVHLGLVEYSPSPLSHHTLAFSVAEFVLVRVQS